jgi:hypothetical protein
MVPAKKQLEEHYQIKLQTKTLPKYMEQHFKE